MTPSPQETADYIRLLAKFHANQRWPEMTAQDIANALQIAASDAQDKIDRANAFKESE